jgi:hypothetical protein
VLGEFRSIYLDTKLHLKFRCQRADLHKSYLRSLTEGKID